VFDAWHNTLKLMQLASPAMVQSVALEKSVLIAYATAEGELAA
jgi:hypothetical protein